MRSRRANMIRRFRWPFASPNCSTCRSRRFSCRRPAEARSSGHAERDQPDGRQQARHPQQPDGRQLVHHRAGEVALDGARLRRARDDLGHARDPRLRRRRQQELRRAACEPADEPTLDPHASDRRPGRPHPVRSLPALLQVARRPARLLGGADQPRRAARHHGLAHGARSRGAGASRPPSRRAALRPGRDGPTVRPRQRAARASARSARPRWR